MRHPAPWPDFAGRQINHGDYLAHPDGTEFVAVRLNGFDDEGDAWRAIYGNPPSISRLCLQIGNKGRAVLSDHSQGPYVLAERVARLDLAFHLARGEELDAYGRRYGVGRKAVEPDADYRARILLLAPLNYPTTKGAKS